jgi:orotate phosphoribosyltransferase
MEKNKITELLFSTGAIEEGHFILPDGRHTDVLLRPLKALQFPPYCRRIAFEIVDHYLDMDVQLVIAASSEAILLAAEIARQLEARIIFPVTSREHETAVLHPDFSIHSGDRAIMVDTLLDEFPAGMRSFGRQILKADARLIGIASLFEVNAPSHIFNVRQITVRRITSNYWSQEECPVCAAGTL